MLSSRGVSSRLLRDPAHLLGPVEDPLPVGVPAVVELPGVLVGPLLRHVVRAVQAAAGPVHEERLVRLERLVPVQPADGVVGEVLAEVVPLLRGPRRQHAGRVADQVRLVLRRLTGQEPVEVLEAQPGRPVVERPGRCRLQGRGVVPLPPRPGGVAVVPQHLGDQRRCSWGSPRSSRPSRWPARRSGRCRSGGGCGRSAATPGSGSTSPWCGTGCSRCPRSWIRVSVSVRTSPPNVVGSPGPTSSISTIRMFGASSGSRRGSTRRSYTDSCIVRPGECSPTGSEETAAPLVQECLVQAWGTLFRRYLLRAAPDVRAQDIRGAPTQHFSWHPKRASPLPGESVAVSGAFIAGRGRGSSDRFQWHGHQRVEDSPQQPRSGQRAIRETPLSSTSIIRGRHDAQALRMIGNTAPAQKATVNAANASDVDSLRTSVAHQPMEYTPGSAL